MPTFKINHWIGNNLPKGTPVLVDRWFHPWNELAVHNSDGINYAFTVPDEPVETYIALRWRDTAKAFFEKYPGAALLEVNPGKYHDRVGEWSFPAEHFAQIALITNGPAVTLQKHLAYPLDRRVSAGGVLRYRYRIFYNTSSDILASAHKENRKVLRLFGENWGYLKPWRQMPGWSEQLTQLLWMQAGMYADGGRTVSSMSELQAVWQTRAGQYINQGRWADYRIPASRSVLRLFNLTAHAIPVKLRIAGFPLSGDVRCRVDKQDMFFNKGLMSVQEMSLRLEPGENDVIVAMQPNQILLVSDVTLSVEN